MSNQNSYSPGLYPLGYIGVNPTTPPRVFIQSFSPGPINYQNNSIGDFWLVSGTEQVWILVGLSNTDPSGRALWVELSGTAGIVYDTNNGQAVPLDGLLNVLGGANITTTALVGPPNTIEINLNDSVTIPGLLTLSALGAGVMTTDSGGVVHTGNGTNGQVLIGGGPNPEWASITSNDGTVILTPGANTLDLSVPGGGGGGGLITAHTDSGNAVVAASAITWAGSGGIINTTGSGSTVVTHLTDGPAGDLLIGGGGAGAAWAALTAGTGVTLTPGVNSLTISAGAGSLTFDGDTGTATPAASVINLLGDTTLTKTVASGATITTSIKNSTQGNLIMATSGASATWGHLVAGANMSIVTTVDGQITLTSAAGAGGTVSAIQGNTGASAGPDGGGVIHTLGDNTSIVIVSSTPNANSTTTSVKSSPTIGGIPTFSGLGTGLVKSTSGLLANVTPGTLGQVLQTNSTLAPQWNTVAAGSGISIATDATTGALTITNSAPAGTGITYPTDAGVAAPASNKLYVYGTTGNTTGGVYNNILTAKGTTINANDTVFIDLTQWITLPATNLGATSGGLSIAGSADTGTFFHSYGTGTGFGNINTFVGVRSGGTTTGTCNPLTVGTAINNTAVGGNTLNSLTTGHNNVAVGYNAMTATTLGVSCVAVGYNALSAMTNATGANTMIGFSAGSTLGTGGQIGNNNTFIGYNCGSTQTHGTFNIYLGTPTIVVGENNVIRIGSTAGGTTNTACYVEGIYGSTNAANALLTTTDSSGKLATLPGGNVAGQLLIGGTGGIAWNTLTAGANITLTNANNNITIASSGGAGTDAFQYIQTSNLSGAWPTSGSTYTFGASTALIQIFDRGGTQFSGTTWTCSKTGIWSFTVSGTINNMSTVNWTSCAAITLNIIVNNGANTRTYSIANVSAPGYGGWVPNYDQLTVTLTALAYITVGGTATFTMMINPDGSPTSTLGLGPVTGVNPSTANGTLISGFFVAS